MAAPFDPSAALISSEKMASYMLSDSHPVARYKAAFFQRLGYSANAPEIFERDIAALPIAHTIDFGAPVHSRKTATRRMLAGPADVRAGVFAVWIIVPGFDTVVVVGTVPRRVCSAAIWVRWCVCSRRLRSRWSSLPPPGKRAHSWRWASARPDRWVAMTS